MLCMVCSPTVKPRLPPRSFKNTGAPVGKESNAEGSWAHQSLGQRPRHTHMASQRSRGIAGPGCGIHACKPATTVQRLCGCAHSAADPFVGTPGLCASPQVPSWWRLIRQPWPQSQPARMPALRWCQITSACRTTRGEAGSPPVQYSTAASRGGRLSPCSAANVSHEATAARAAWFASLPAPCTCAALRQAEPL